MRILLLADCYLPSKKSSAKLVSDLAFEMASMGHEVTVVVPDADVGRADARVEDGVVVLRVNCGRIKNVNRLTRAFNEVRLSETIWRRCRSYFRSNPCDSIVFYSPSIFFGRLVERLKKLWNCRSYLILRDIFPQWAVDAGVLKEGMVCSYFRRREMQQYHAADIIGVEASGCIPYLRNRLSADKKIEVLYNWASIASDIRSGINYRDRLGLGGRFVYFYGGNIGVAQEMENIIELADRLKEYPDIHFLLVGEGSEFDRLKAGAKGLDLDNFTMLPSVSQREYLDMLAQFDVGLISLNRSLKSHNIPSKILGYMNFSKPILASINPGNELENILNHYDAGLVSESGDHEKLLGNALKLYRETETRSRLAANGRKVLDELFSSRRAAVQILSALDVRSSGSAENQGLFNQSYNHRIDDRKAIG